jgi:hypothetical protein
MPSPVCRLTAGRPARPVLVENAVIDCELGIQAAGIAVPLGVIEILLGVVFALLAYRHPVEALALCWLAAHGAAVALIDIAVRRIPNVLAVSAYAGVTLLLACDCRLDSTSRFRRMGFRWQVALIAA